MVNEEKKISTLPKFLVGPALHRPAEPGLHPEEQLQGARPAHALHNHGGQCKSYTKTFFVNNINYIIGNKHDNRHKKKFIQTKKNNAEWPG